MNDMSNNNNTVENMQQNGSEFRNIAYMGTHP